MSIHVILHGDYAQSVTKRFVNINNIQETICFCECMWSAIDEICRREAVDFEHFCALVKGLMPADTALDSALTVVSCIYWRSAVGRISHGDAIGHGIRH